MCYCAPVLTEIFRDVPDDKEEERAEVKQTAQLMRVHRNLAHPSNRLFA